MSSEYYLHLEGKHDGKWMLLDHKILKVRNNKLTLCPLYASYSRSYFDETYQKLSELGRVIKYDDFSDGLKEEYNKELFAGDSFACIYPIAVSYTDIKNCIPKGVQYEHAGYVEKSQLYQYEIGEYEDFDYLSAREYKCLNKKLRKAYKFYEWDSSYGWFKHFKEIIQCVNRELTDWNDINYDAELNDIRVVVIMFIVH